MEKVIKFFSSLKLTLFLLFSLALTSIIGTIIPQGLPKSEYAVKLNPVLFKIFDFFNIFDMYHSWWFISLLALLIINLIFCSIKNYKVTVKRVYDRNIILTEKLLDTIIFKQTFSVPKRKFNIQKVEGFIKKHLNTEKFLKNNNNGEIHYFINKFKFSNFGYYVVHLSLIIIAIGAIIGGICGFKGNVNIVEGGIADRIILKNMKIKQLGFKIKCLDFDVKFYPNGTPKDYKSLVEIIDGSQRFKKIIRVNHPLTYKGITFYQASYGTIGQKVEIRVFDRKTKELIFDRYVSLRLPVNLDNKTKFVVMNYIDNFQGFGPASQIAIVSDNFHSHFTSRPFVIFKNFPDFDLKHRNGRYFFQLVDAKVKYYTGLQVTKDPGVWLIWVGCFIMTVGFFITFFLINKKFWIKIREEKSGKVHITFAGSCRKNRIGFEKEFDEKFNILRSIFQ